MVVNSDLLSNTKVPQPLRLRPEYFDNSHKNEYGSFGSFLFLSVKLNCALSYMISSQKLLAQTGEYNQLLGMIPFPYNTLSPLITIVGTLGLHSLYHEYTVISTNSNSILVSVDFLIDNYTVFNNQAVLQYLSFITIH